MIRRLDTICALRWTFFHSPILACSSLFHRMQSLLAALIMDNSKAEKTEKNKYLSIVVTSRNDNHGGNLLHRMQVFVNTLASQCKNYNLDTELIIVEWNPPADQKRIREVIEWPLPLDPLTVRVIEVPKEIHDTIPNSDKLPLFQYIAKNAGIRRASGNFILATNIDILFSEELIWFLSLKQLEPDSYYRTDRYDIRNSSIPLNLSVEDQLNYCRRDAVSVYDVHGRKELSSKKRDDLTAVDRRTFSEQYKKEPALFLAREAAPHTSACGDFTLMAKTKWHQFMGYPELGLNDLYIDGLILYMAKASGMGQVILKSPMQIFHINHKNSTTEHAKRIQRCDNLDYHKEYRPWCEKMVRERQPTNVNDDSWGLVHENLKEYTITEQDKTSGNTKSNTDEFRGWITKLAISQNRLYYRDQTPESLNQLVELVHRYTPTKIVELGTLSGLSLRAWLSAKSNAEIIAVDLSFKPLHESKQIIPLDLSRVRLLEQNILNIDFKSLWALKDRVIFYVDAHDLPDAPIMEYVLQNVLPALPEGSVVAVDDLWYSPTLLTNDDAALHFFEEKVIHTFDPLIYRELFYAPFWKGGSFVGFREVMPLMKWANMHRAELVFDPEIKMVYFEGLSSLKNKFENIEFNAEDFSSKTGKVRYNAVGNFKASGESTGKTQQALELCRQGAKVFKSDRYAETISYFEQALRLHPAISGAYYAQAVCLAQMGKFENAAGMLEKEIGIPYPHPKARALLDDIQDRIRIQQEPQPSIKQKIHDNTITIFACPKPFKRSFDIIQRNAIKSWTLLRPKPQILLFGDSEGTAAVAEEFGLTHIQNVQCNELGTPLTNDMFEKAQAYANSDILVYVNADIILPSNFLAGIREVYNNLPAFLIVGQRWDADIDFLIDYSDADWESRLIAHAKNNGQLHPSTGIDYFIFKRNTLRSIPPFAIGRPGWDNWMIYNATVNNIPVVDATEVIFVIHQNHGYSHIKGGKREVWNGAEAQKNLALCGDRNIFKIDHATWKLTPSGLTQISAPAHVFFQRGIEFINEGNPQIALINFDRTLTLDQSFPDIHCARAIALLQIGRLDEAVASVQAELTLQPNHDMARHLLSDLYRIRQTLLTKQQETPERPSITPHSPHNLPTEQIIGKIAPHQKTIFREQELKIYSQNGEDGILLHIFSKIGTTNRLLVEIGMGAGTGWVECNTTNLLINLKWSGLLIEGNRENVIAAKNYFSSKLGIKQAQVNVIHSFVTAENIDELLADNGMVGKIDLLSIDIDGNDYWIWKAISAITPRVVVIEYNATLGDDKSITVKYDPSFDRHQKHPSGWYHGASLAALKNLANSKGYILVGCDSNGLNAFFVHKEAAIDKIDELSVPDAYYPHKYRAEFGSVAEQFERIKHLPFDYIITPQKEMPQEQVRQSRNQIHRGKAGNRSSRIDDSKKSLCLFLNVYYQAFLNSHYRNNPQLQSASYQEQLISLQEASFGDSDSYSEGLKKAGWKAEDLIINCLPLQSAWAAENNFHNYSNMVEITVEQIRRARPQAVYFQDTSIGTSDFLSSIRPSTDLIVGQIACAMSSGTDFSKFDIIFSSFPHYIQQFHERGITAYYQPLAFDPRVLQKLHNHEKMYPVTFIGGLGKTLTWVNRTALLEYLAESFTIDFWGYGIETLSPDSPILKRHHGEAWGLDMLSVLHQSLITINCHGEIAGNYANNVRLFEATGCGALLITDYKDNLNELFEIGKEVVAYRSPEECAALIKYYLSNPKEAEEIARAGQARTLRDHTMNQRMSKTAEIFNKRLALRKSILGHLVKPKI